MDSITLKVSVKFAWWSKPYLLALKIADRFVKIDIENAAAVLLSGAKLVVNGKKTNIRVS